MSRTTRSSVSRTLQYLLGWRLGVLAVGFLIAIAAVAVGFDVSATEILWGAVAVLAVFLPLVTIVARAAVLANDRHDKFADRMAGVESGLGPAAGSLSDLRGRFNQLDRVVADAVRKPDDPTTLPWPSPVGRSAPILLLPSAAYHLAEIMPLADALNQRGIETRVAVGEAHWPRIATGLGWYDTPVYALPEPSRAAEGVAAVITMKDWAGYGEVVIAAKEEGIPTYAKVEGAQDFDDIDTPYARAAYRSADHILCQGQNDFEGLDGSRHIVGSSRLERLLHAPVLPIDSDHVVINLNFTYGVLEEARQHWIESAVAACEKLGVPFTVAVHPAERHRPGIPGSSTVPISRLLFRASVLVSRFSTVPFEAMARGIPFVYHNPHGENVSTFAEEAGAFRTTVDTGTLVAALEESRDWRSDYRDRSASFFGRQIDIDPQLSSAERAAAAVVRLLGGA